MTDLSYSIEGRSPEEIANYLGMKTGQVAAAILKGAKTYQDVYNCKGMKEVEDYVDPTPEQVKRAEEIIANAKEATAPNPFLKWPRNRPCPCNSGKKFKRCCDGELPARIPASNAARILKAMKEKGII